MPTKVEDEEELYRRIPKGSTGYAIRDGQCNISASAFNDPGFKPSVDRSAMRHDPRDTRLSETDGVTKLIAHEVRAITNIPVNPEDKRDLRQFCVDVMHRPIVNAPGGQHDNLAHSQIECAPSVESGSRFKKIKEALAIIANRHGFIVSPG